MKILFFLYYLLVINNSIVNKISMLAALYGSDQYFS